jgi:hypothetical protein
MKTFNEIRNPNLEDLRESRLLRKGGVLILARSAKRHGDDATKSLNNAKRKILSSSLDTEEQRLKSIQNGLLDLCDGLISMRKQNGAITGIVTTSALLNERTNSQLSDAIKRP